MKWIYQSKITQGTKCIYWNTNIIWSIIGKYNMVKWNKSKNVKGSIKFGTNGRQAKGDVDEDPLFLLIIIINSN